VIDRNYYFFLKKSFKLKMETSLASSFPLMSSLDELESILDKFSQKNEQQQQHHQQHHQQQQQQPLQQHSVYASNNFSDKINE